MQIFKNLKSLDWDNLIGFSQESQRVLDKISSDKKFLKSLVDNVSDNNLLLEKSECNPTLSKLVFYSDSDIEIRLHLFNNDQQDKPHDHRWSFSSRIINGGYKHVIYSILGKVDEKMDMSNIKPIYERYEKKGDSYSIDHTIAHTTMNVAPDTVTLIVRGPVKKHKWFSLDREKNKVSFLGRVSGKRIGFDQTSMNQEQFNQVRNKLQSLNVI